MEEFTPKWKDSLRVARQFDGMISAEIQQERQA